MTQDEIIRMAREANDFATSVLDIDAIPRVWRKLRDERFANLVAEATKAQPQGEPVAYMDAVDNRLVYVAPKRKGWMSEREDKEWRKFHSDNQYNIPLIIKEQK